MLNAVGPSLVLKRPTTMLDGDLTGLDLGTV